jgi:uncharacterized membrane protein
MTTKTPKQTAHQVFWYGNNHRAWSASDTVRQALTKFEAKHDKWGIRLSTIGIVLTIVCTIVTTIIMGDWHALISNFFAFLLFFAGMLMMSGNFSNAVSSS